MFRKPGPAVNTYLKLEERNVSCHSHINRIHRHCHQIIESLDVSGRQMEAFVQLNTEAPLSAGHLKNERWNQRLLNWASPVIPQLDQSWISQEIMDENCLIWTTLACNHVWVATPPNQVGQDLILKAFIRKKTLINERILQFIGQGLQYFTCLIISSFTQFGGVNSTHQQVVLVRENGERWWKHFVSRDLQVTRLLS